MYENGEHREHMISIHLLMVVGVVCISAAKITNSQKEHLSEAAL